MDNLKDHLIAIDYLDRLRIDNLDYYLDEITKDGGARYSTNKIPIKHLQILSNGNIEKVD